ncbi:hypothetical protein C8Q72DRAFT_830101 [Fomitopsis betulina]|nr:hypothetical protein C8Q72DRAFT_830101 [Fomitopsis betulina]
MSIDGAELVQALKHGMVVNYAWTAFSVFPLYDYVVTTGLEWTTFWGQQVPLGIFVLMLLTRVFTIALVTTNFVYTWYASETLAQCRNVFIISSVFTQLPYALEAVISAIRTYALSGSGLLWATVVFLAGVWIVPLQMYDIAVTQYEFTRIGTLPICIVMPPTGESEGIRILLAAHVSNIASQVILIGITWSRTLFLVRGSDRKELRASLKRHTIAWLLLRDGTVYFVAMLVLHVIDLILWFQTDVQYFGTFFQSMQIVLLSRLLLNLRQASLSYVHAGASLAGFATSNFLDDLTHVSSIALTPEQDIAMATSPTYGRSEDTNTQNVVEGDDADGLASEQRCNGP